MKVLWIDPVNSDAQFLNALALALSQIGHEVVVRSNQREGFDPPKSVSWIPFGSAKTIPRSLEGKIGWRLAVACTYPIDWMRAVRFARSMKAKTVLVSTNLALPKFDAWAMSLLRASGIAPVIIVHKPYRDFFQNSNGMHSARYETYYRKASRILVMNRYTQEILQKLYGLPEDRFVRFPHPHLSDLLSSIRPSQPLRDFLLRWAEGGQVISFLSHQSGEHGFETLLGALPLLKNRVHGMRVLIVSTLRDVAARRRFEEKVEAAGCSGHCLFCWMPYTYSELLAYLGASSVVVVPYDNATQSGVIPLAAGFGIPVVATAVGGLPEMVVPGETGELVPPQNPRALADAIAKVVDPEVLPMYKRKAHEFARTTLSPLNAAAVVCHALHELGPTS